MGLRCGQPGKECATVISAYIRVSTDRQDAENQRYEILKLADERKLTIDEWHVETVSGTKSYRDRKLGEVLNGLQSGDVLIVTEISRLGRSLMEIMTLLHECMLKNVGVWTCKEHFELGDNINSKILAFAFGLAAEIERQLISQRTKEALARKKAEGVKLGRPKGSLGQSKLDGKAELIADFLSKGVSKASICKILECHPGTLRSFVKSRGLLTERKEP
jgi:DNA invertase Pin-like site-specific DNA recombinase